MKKINLELYKKMFLIRVCEERIKEEYPKDEMKTPAHLCIGEEAIAVGVCQALGEKDNLFATYRNHGIYLARTNDTDKFFAELFGKASGTAHGKAGSMHIFSPEHGFLGASAVVASTIPVAVGASFALRYKKKAGVTVSFFGDGAIDEGVFWECLNIACLKKLPIIFVCEDNDLAIHAKKSDRHGFKSFAEIVEKYNCHVLTNQTTDVEKIYELTQKAISLIHKTKKPVFMHLRYYRYLEHVGINYDFHFGYRSEEEYKKWLRIDPIKLQRKKLLRSGFSEEVIDKIESEILRKIDKSVKKARDESYPEENELRKDVYA